MFNFEFTKHTHKYNMAESTEKLISWIFPMKCRIWYIVQRKLHTYIYIYIIHHHATCKFTDHRHMMKTSAADTVNCDWSHIHNEIRSYPAAKYWTILYHVFDTCLCDHFKDVVTQLRRNIRTQMQKKMFPLWSVIEINQNRMNKSNTLMPDERTVLIFTWFYAVELVVSHIHSEYVWCMYVDTPHKDGSWSCHHHIFRRGIVNVWYTSLFLQWSFLTV